MRFYAFTNFYISSIQHGIQSGHVADTLNTKYALDRPGYATARAALQEWQEKHLTYMVMNGGCAPLIHQRKAQFQCLMKAAMLPWNAFNEPGLDNALTAYGGVLTEDIYDPAPDYSVQMSTTTAEWPPRKPDTFDDAYSMWKGNRFEHQWTPQKLLSWFVRMHRFAS